MEVDEGAGHHGGRKWITDVARGLVWESAISVAVNLLALVSGRTLRAPAQNYHDTRLRLLHCVSNFASFYRASAVILIAEALLSRHLPLPPFLATLFAMKVLRWE